MCEGFLSVLSVSSLLAFFPREMCVFYQAKVFISLCRKPLAHELGGKEAGPSGDILDGEENQEFCSQAKYIVFLKILTQQRGK